MGWTVMIDPIAGWRVDVSEPETIFLDRRRGRWSLGLIGLMVLAIAMPLGAAAAAFML